MSDILSKLASIPLEAWCILFGASLGAVLSLLGVWLTNRTNIKQLRIQLKHERDVKEQEAFRSRHEELYIASRKYFDGLVNSYLPYRSVMKGELTFNQALNLTIERGKNPDFEFHRVTMLLDLYFQELLPVFKKVIEVRDKLWNLVDGYKKQYKLGDIDGAKWLDLFQPLFEELSDKATKFENCVSEYRRNA